LILLFLANASPFLLMVVFGMVAQSTVSYQELIESGGKESSPRTENVMLDLLGNWRREGGVFFVSGHMNRLKRLLPVSRMSFHMRAKVLKKDNGQLEMAAMSFKGFRWFS
jgi:hypothetical protein